MEGHILTLVKATQLLFGSAEKFLKSSMRSMMMMCVKINALRGKVCRLLIEMALTT